MKFDVMWHAQKDSRGYYDSTTMLNDSFDKHDCTHHFCWDTMPAGVEGGVVVVHGGREIGRIDKLNMDLDKLKWALVIFLGDEECSFPVEQVEHQNIIGWIQEPIPGRHDYMKRRMICGYGHRIQQYITKEERDLEWFFGGQVNHERRRACVDALRTLDWGGFVIETKGFHQGISMNEYIRTLCRAHIVPCPSGVMSPDSARPWDALECGALPILDDLSPARKEPGFWDYVLGQHALPVITDWSTLPIVIDQLKHANLHRLRSDAQTWWQDYKWRFNQWLGIDIKILTSRS